MTSERWVSAVCELGGPALTDRACGRDVKPGKIMLTRAGEIKVDGLRHRQGGQRPWWCSTRL